MRELPQAPRPDRPATRSGLGVVMISVYAVFAVAATARAGYQVGTKLEEAPVAYLLSALAAVLYVVATLALVRSTSRSRTVAWASVTTELVGVVGVGLLSFARPDLFPEPTVWSHLGEGYGYVPLVLPVAGLWWLARTRPRTSEVPADAAPPTSPPTPTA